MSPITARLVALASAAAVSGSMYAFLVRPRLGRWGATEDEVRRRLPGDELESPMGYRRVSTRAITIDAPPDEVWPWLVQMGSGRAGFYTHEWVERLLFVTYADGHSANRIHPEWQELHVGDRVPYSRLNTVDVTMVDRSLGAVARPARVYFVTVLPKTRSGKMLRRAMQAICEGRDPGDLTTIEDPTALDQLREAMAR